MLLEVIIGRLGCTATHGPPTRTTPHCGAVAEMNGELGKLDPHEDGANGKDMPTRLATANVRHMLVLALLHD